MLFLIFFLFSCKEEISKDIKFQVLVKENEIFKLKNVSFQNIENIKNISSNAIEILEDGVFTLDEDSQKLIFKTYNSATTNYRNIKQTIYPLDFKSLIMFTLFYNFEHILTQWEKEFPNFFSRTKKIKIIYDPKIKYNIGGSQIYETEGYNASYLTGTYDFLFLKTSEKESLPIKANIAIIAHEFFHLVFDILFAKQDSKIYELNSSSSQFVLNGINEGLADYFSWFFTEETSGYNYSLNENSENRKIPSQLTLKDVREDVIQKKCQGGFYCEGTVLASSLYEISEEKLINKKQIATKILTAITQLADYWINLEETERFDFHLLLELILNQSSNEEKKTYCKYFKKYFNDRNNKDKVLSLCNT